MFEKMSYKSRRRWAAFVLIVGMSLYVVLAVTLVSLLERPSILLELVIYVGLGFAWVLPFRGLFRGIGQPDPDAADDNDS
jgi:hypothetical protein